MLNVGSIFFGKGGNPSGGGGGAVESVTGDEGIFVNNGAKFCSSPKTIK